MHRVSRLQKALAIALIPGPAWAQQATMPQGAIERAPVSALEAPGKAEPGTTEPKKKRDFLIAPVPISNPASGSGVAVGALMLYNPNDAPRQWISGGGVVLTSRGTKGAGLFHSMSLSQDKMRFFALVSYFHNNAKYTGIGAEAGDRDDVLELHSNQLTAQGQALFRVFPHGYAGLRLRLADVNATSDADTTSLTPPPPADQLNSTLFAVGPSFAYDTRDSSTQPHRGVNLSASWLFGLKGLGDSFAHNKLSLAANAYFPFGTETVFAVRGSFCAAGGDVPYYDLCQFGAGADLRGYPAGRYRDRASWAVQAELRQHIHGRWGAVGFFGLGGIAPSAGDILSRGNALPSAGLGVRYRPFKDNDLQLRVDIAIGKNDKGFNVGIAEAF